MGDYGLAATSIIIYYIIHESQETLGYALLPTIAVPVIHHA